MSQKGFSNWAVAKWYLATAACILGVLWLGASPASATPPKGLGKTATVLSCASNTVAIGGTTSCEVRVEALGMSPTTPVGTVGLAPDASKGGSFSVAGCSLSELELGVARCQAKIIYTAGDGGDHNLLATYGGDPTHEGDGDVEVVTAADEVHTSFSCTPSRIDVKDTTTCKVLVEGLGAKPTAPAGDVHFETGNDGSFDVLSCSLSQVQANLAACEAPIAYTANVHGDHYLVANYDGDATHQGGNDIELVVATANAAASISCNPKLLPENETVSCKVLVEGLGEKPTTPEGKVQFETDNGGFFNMFSCDLGEVEPGLAACKETVVYSPDKVGTHNLTAVYLGDSTHEKVSGTETITATEAPPIPDDVVFDFSCTPTEIVPNGAPTICTVLVEEWGVPGTPTGKVSFATMSEGSFSIFNCGLIEVKSGLASCPVPMTWTAKLLGYHKLWANYSGDELRRPYSDSEIITAGYLSGG